MFVTGPGFQMAQKFIENVFEKHIDWTALIQNDDNYKNILQVKIQKEFKVTPHYLEIEYDMELGYKMGVYICLGQPIHSVSCKDAINFSIFKNFKSVHDYILENNNPPPIILETTEKSLKLTVNIMDEDTHKTLWFSYPSTFQIFPTSFIQLQLQTMKKYIPVTKNLFFVDKWRHLAIAGIKFMQNIHQLHHVYLDFKFANTYYEEELCQFIFADYDSLFHINNKLLSEYTNDFKYYYLIQGAELDKPCRSFKYDLLAFGYFLAKLTSLEKEYAEGYQWQFEKLATNYRKMNGPFSNIDQLCIKNIDQQIIELRNNEHKNFNTFIKNYFEEVNRMNWFLETCPSKEWYNQLCDIFSFNHHEF
jgi:hypothetical protein